MKRQIGWTLLLALLLLAACTGPSADTSGTPDTDPASAPPTELSGTSSTEPLSSTSGTEAPEAPVTVTLYQQNAEPHKISITDAATIETLWTALQPSALTVSEAQYRGVAVYYLDFHNGYAVGLYQDLPYAYQGGSVSENGGLYILENSDQVGYTTGDQVLSLVKELLGAQ